MLMKCVFFALVITFAWYRINHWEVEGDAGARPLAAAGAPGGPGETEAPSSRGPVLAMVTFVPLVAGLLIAPAAFRNYSVLNAVREISPQLLSDIVREVMADTRVMRTELAQRVREVSRGREAGPGGLREVFRGFDSDGDGSTRTATETSRTRSSTWGSWGSTCTTREGRPPRCA